MSRFVSHGIAVLVGMLLAAELPHTDAQNTIGAAGKGLIERLGSIEARMSAQEALAKNLGQRLSDTEGAMATAKADIAASANRVVKAHSRLDRASLVARSARQSPGWACGGEHKEAPDNLFVMYGSRDGTSCRVQNINYYKEIALSIPGEGQ